MARCCRSRPAAAAAAMLLLCCLTAAGAQLRGGVDAASVASTAAAAAAAVDQALNKPVIITVGDSITAFGSSEGGWVTKLAAAYGMTSDILNKGVNMGNARSGVAIAAAITSRLFPPGEQAARVKLVTLCFGANDASIKRADPAWRFVPLADYSRLLNEAVDTLQAAGITNILLITPPPASPTRVDRSLAVTAQYAAAVKEVAAAQQVPVADLFSAVLAEPDWATSALLPDGLHLTPRGNDIMLAAVMAGIGRLPGPAVSPHALWEALGPVTV